MAGLVGYASSDDEEEEIEQPLPVKKSPSQAPASEPAKAEIENVDEASRKVKDQKSSSEPSAPAQQSAIPLGPSLPPLDEPLLNEELDSSQAPLSPYSASRALLRDLTLPSNPNLDIPPSPPGSPRADATKKLDQFLELKKKGVHFNAKLEQSSGLKNPSLMDKLLSFVEIDAQSQYSTTLSTDLWDPNGFPERAFRDKLRKSHAKIAKEAEAEKASGNRTAIDFVPSTTATYTSTSGAGGLSRGEKRKGGRTWD
ncbi:HCNGP-like protein-domain-containing protein [Thelonectria olida]|uniref:HCNGP-like protein-domain-containing protein n=1 Tax=Thelonectria olida TaxID=1576542 RepID=A0A9P8WK16_9HYPO|nr:HCNGP-like protein-domain-containing protein [Thelonectria olida]